MRALFIGGTGTISMACTRLAAQSGFELTLINRGNRISEIPDGVRTITADVSDEDTVCKVLSGEKFDCVADFIAFSPAQVERDIRLFEGITGQYIFISSASVYQKPLSNYLVNESTPLCNPFWDYSQEKIECEEVLMRRMRDTGFPVTIVRPSHTYDNRSVPVAIHGTNGSWQVIQRIIDGKPVIVHGDGLSLWTFTYNEDFAKGFVGLMGNPHAIGEAVGITSDETHTWDEAYKIISQKLGCESKLCHVATDKLIRYDKSLRGPLLGDKANSIVFDNSKLKRLVPGFVATTRFDSGVRNALAYINNHPDICKCLDPKFDKWCDDVVAKESM